MNEYDRYQVRYAAGQYWLIDMQQSGRQYVRPVIINELGAAVWDGMKAGNTIEQISQILSKEFKVAAEEIQTDILEFIRQLKQQSVVIED